VRLAGEAEGCFKTPSFADAAETRSRFCLVHCDPLVHVNVRRRRQDQLAKQRAVLRHV
jgi:hypothetical protein